jgi:hypothetical protein
MRKIFACLLLLLALPAYAAPAAPPPKAVNATDGIFTAFQTHPLVGLGEWHGLAQELDFYAALVRDPRFASEVGNIVLEIGGAAQQATVDRYVNGENIPYPDLRKVWTSGVGWLPTVTYMGSINLYATIREVNRGLPPEKRIKVWLGEPPIDWSNIQTKADWDPIVVQRDTYPAQLVEKEILAKGKKALLIYGSAHFGQYPGPPNIRALLDQDHPGALFTVAPYGAFNSKACATLFERDSKKWPVPGLISPVRGSALEKDAMLPGCAVFGKPPAGITQAHLETSQRNYLGLTSDALLYLGPRDRFVFSPRSQDIYLDQDFRAEIERRVQVMTGKPMTGSLVGGNPASPRPFFQ